MQHPRNRIVKLVKNMALYLVEVYEIDGTNINIIDKTDYIDKFGISSNVKVPMRYANASENDIDALSDSECIWNILGRNILEPKIIIFARNICHHVGCFSQLVLETGPIISRSNML